VLTVVTDKGVGATSCFTEDRRPEFSPSGTAVYTRITKIGPA